MAALPLVPAVSLAAYRGDTSALAEPASPDAISQEVDLSEQRPSSLVKVCGWRCGRTLVDGTWQLVPPPAGARLTHGLCPVCEPKAYKDAGFNAYRLPTGELVIEAAEAAR